VKKLSALLAAVTLAALAVLGAWPAAQDIRTEDRNGDGRPDVWRRYDRLGRLISVGTDNNFDGRADVEESYERGVLVRRESDRNFDNRVDLHEEFDPRTHEQTRSVIDVDGDGAADLLVLFRDGHPVFTAHARPLAVNVRTAARPGGADAPALRDAAGPLVALADPFSADVAVRGASLPAQAPDEWVGLSTSGGLPALRAATVGVPRLSASLAVVGVRSVPLTALPSPALRGPPLS
jgi:hypothetical protein